MVPWLPLEILMGTPKWKANNELNATKIPTYTFIQSYIFISFSENFPPKLLFGTVFYLEL